MDLIKIAKDYLTDELVTSLASRLGESSSATRSGFGAALPSLLAGLLSKGSQPGGAKGLFDLVSQPELAGGLLNQLPGLFSGSQQESNPGLGDNLLQSIFGGQSSGIADIISRFGGLKSSSASSLLKLAAPFLLSIIGKKIKDGGLNLGSFVDLLKGQWGSVKEHAPSGLLDSLGSVVNMSSISNFAGGATQAAAQAGNGFKKFLPWLLLILAALLLWWLLKGCNADKMKSEADAAMNDAQTVVDSAAAKVSNVAADIYRAGEDLVGKTVTGFEHLGEFIRLKFASGQEIIVPANGTEAKLVRFIDSSDPVSKDLWFEFDRILFETGSAALKAESKVQVDNISALMKAYPKVNLKIGGYTDNTGNAAANMKLSKERADAVMNAIVANGVDKARLEAEGYGDQHPVASNDTEEGRAKNRRIAVSVRAK